MIHPVEFNKIFACRRWPARPQNQEKANPWISAQKRTQFLPFTSSLLSAILAAVAAQTVFRLPNRA